MSLSIFLLTQNYRIYIFFVPTIFQQVKWTTTRHFTLSFGKEAGQLRWTWRLLIYKFSISLCDILLVIWCFPQHNALVVPDNKKCSGNAIGFTEYLVHYVSNHQNTMWRLCSTLYQFEAVISKNMLCGIRLLWRDYKLPKEEEDTITRQNFLISNMPSGKCRVFFKRTNSLSTKITNEKYATIVKICIKEQVD